MERNPSEANNSSTHQDINLVLWNTKFHYRVHNSSPFVPILGQINPVHALSSLLFNTHFNIIFPSTRGSYKFSLSFKFPHPNTVCFWSDSDRASSLICGNKMPTRRNRWYLLQILLLAQHVSGTIMPIIRRSRVLYRWSLPVVFGALVFKLSLWCGTEVYVSGARNMLNKQ